MKTLAEMNTTEIGALLKRAARVLADQAAELCHSPEPGDIRAAMATVIGMLIEIADMHPDKRAEVGALVAKYQPQALDGKNS